MNCASNVEVTRVNPNGLVKTIYTFCWCGFDLVYHGFMRYTRSDTDEKWLHDWEPMLGEQYFLYRRDDDPEFRDLYKDWWDYRSKELDRRSGKSYGAYFSQNNLEEQRKLCPCPDDVALEVRTILMERLQVIWK